MFVYFQGILWLENVLFYSHYAFFSGFISLHDKLSVGPLVSLSPRLLLVISTASEPLFLRYELPLIWIFFFY